MIININNDIKLSSFHIIFDGSTMNEEIGTRGVNHLLEHLICKSYDHLENDFQRYGIYNNAYTSSDKVDFYISGLDKYVNKYKDEMINCILSYELNEKDLEKEKKIVIEEYKNSFLDQSKNHYLNLYRKLYDYYSPIGYIQDIKNVSFGKCKELINKYYKKPTRILNISKTSYIDENIKFRKIDNVKEIKRNTKEVEIVKDYLDIDKIGINKTVLELNNKYDGESILNVSPIINKDIPYIKYINRMLGYGLKSPLYDEIREKRGLSYYVYCYANTLNDDNCNIIISTEVSKGNETKIQEVIGDVLNNKKKYLNKERFEIVKDNLLIDKEKKEILKYKNYHIYLDKNSIYNIIDNITLDKVYDIFDKYYKWDEFYKSIYNEEFKK